MVQVVKQTLKKPLWLALLAFAVPCLPMHGTFEDFYAACKNGNLSVVQTLLLDDSISFNGTNNQGITPFSIACYNGHVAIVKILLADDRVDPGIADNDSATPFYRACWKGRIKMVEVLLASRDRRIKPMEPLANGITPFMAACYSDHKDLVRYLLQDSRIDPMQATRDGLTALHIACENDCLRVVKILLADNRVDPARVTQEGVTPFFCACRRGHVGVVILLQAKGIDPMQAASLGRTPFYIACENGHVDLARILLANNRVDPNKADTSGITPFMVACYNGHGDLVTYLLQDNRIDPMQAANFGRTALHIACENNHLGVVRKLLADDRVDPRVADNDGVTPLFIACRKGYLELIDEVLKHPIIDSNRYLDEIHENIVSKKMLGEDTGGLERIEQLIMASVASMDKENPRSQAHSEVVSDPPRINIEEFGVAIRRNMARGRFLPPTLQSGGGEDMQRVEDEAPQVPTLAHPPSYHNARVIIRKPSRDRRTPKFTPKQLAIGTAYGAAWAVIAMYWGYRAVAYMLTRSSADQTPREETTQAIG